MKYKIHKYNNKYYILNKWFGRLGNLNVKWIARWRLTNTQYAPRDWFAHVSCSHCKWRLLVIVHGVLWLVPLYYRLCRVFSWFLPRAVCKKWNKTCATYFRLKLVFLWCGSVHFEREKSRTKLERNGVTLKFSCVHTVWNRSVQRLKWGSLATMLFIIEF